MAGKVQPVMNARATGPEANAIFAPAAGKVKHVISASRIGAEKIATNAVMVGKVSTVNLVRVAGVVTLAIHAEQAGLELNVGCAPTITCRKAPVFVKSVQMDGLVAIAQSVHQTGLGPIAINVRMGGRALTALYAHPILAVINVITAPTNGLDRIVIHVRLDTMSIRIVPHVFQVDQEQGAFVETEL
jgi:hypothetical protein